MNRHYYMLIPSWYLDISFLQITNWIRNWRVNVSLSMWLYTVRIWTGINLMKDPGFRAFFLLGLSKIISMTYVEGDIYPYLSEIWSDRLRKFTRIATDTRESIRKRKLFLIWYDELMNGISPISCFFVPVEKWGLSGKRIVPRESEGVNLFRIDNMDFGNVVVLLHRSRSRSISIHGGKYLLARREDSSASYKFCSGRI